MRGLDPRIHHSSPEVFRSGWIAGSSPAMTETKSKSPGEFLRGFFVIFTRHSGASPMVRAKRGPMAMNAESGQVI
jgi:hypothetical protein